MNAHRSLEFCTSLVVMLLTGSKGMDQASLIDLQQEIELAKRHSVKSEGVSRAETLATCADMQIGTIARLRNAVKVRSIEDLEVGLHKATTMTPFEGTEYASQLEAYQEASALLQELNPGLFDAIGDAVGAMGSAVSTTVDEAASSLFQAVGGIFTWS